MAGMGFMISSFASYKESRHSAVSNGCPHDGRAGRAWIATFEWVLGVGRTARARAANRTSWKTPALPPPSLCTQVQADGLLPEPEGVRARWHRLSRHEYGLPLLCTASPAHWRFAFCPSHCAGARAR